jgi:Mannosyltransferase (PIG-V)
VEFHSWSIRNSALSFFRDDSVRSALLAFVFTRSIILLLFVLTAQLYPVPVKPGLSEESTLSVRKIPFYRIMAKRVSVADANWYMGIARDGYEQRQFSTEREYNWAFFPLYPLVLRAVAKLTREYALTGLLLSSFFFFLALVLLHKTALLFGFDLAVAGRTVLYLATFPVSYFFMLPVSESLFLLLIVASFYAGKREWWWLAGATGALASGTRITGVLLLPALALLYLETYRTYRRLTVLALFLIPVGLLSYMYFLYSTTGNALAFKDIMISWGRQPGFFLTPLIDYLRQPLLLAKGWDFRIINFAAAVTAIVCGIILTKWRMWSMAFFTLASVFVSLSSGNMQSQARYVMVLFPVFMVLGRAGNNNRTHKTIFLISLILLILATLLFCYEIGFAMS